MVTRKGMGKGKGKGYKNIVKGYDSRVHAQSRKGIKQPQRIKKIIIDQSNFEKIKKAEKQKMNLENKGFRYINTRGIGFDKFEVSYVPEVKGWVDTSKTYSDGSETIEWTSKNKKVHVFDNTQFGSGWVVSSTSLKKGEPPQLMSDTNNTKEQAFRKAIQYMQENKS